MKNKDWKNEFEKLMEGRFYTPELEKFVENLLKEEYSKGYGEGYAHGFAKKIKKRIILKTVGNDWLSNG